MPKDITHTIKLVRERVTPGTVVFKEVTENGKPPKLKTQYIQNWVEGIADAQAIEVTIKVAA